MTVLDTAEIFKSVTAVKSVIVIIIIMEIFLRIFDDDLQS